MAYIHLYKVRSKLKLVYNDISQDNGYVRGGGRSRNKLQRGSGLSVILSFLACHILTCVKKLCKKLIKLHSKCVYYFCINDIFQYRDFLKIRSTI